MLKVLLWMLMGQICPGGGECVPIHPVCDPGTLLLTFTEAIIPSDRTRVKLGVGERTTVSIVPTPTCPVTWHLTGPGALLPNPDGASAVFSAHDRASGPTVTAMVNGVPFSVFYNVVEPASETARKMAEYFYPAGQASAGMLLETTVHPTDVSFMNVQIRELAAPPTNLFGYFPQTFTVAELTHAQSAAWVPLSMENEALDEAGIVDAPPQWNFGTFQWAIPVRWRVASGAEAALPNRIQTFQMHNSSGTLTVTKMGASVTRSP